MNKNDSILDYIGLQDLPETYNTTPVKCACGSTIFNKTNTKDKFNCADCNKVLELKKQYKEESCRKPLDV